MSKIISVLHIIFLSLIFTTIVQAADNAPWGKASAESIEYAPQKVVYDAAFGDVQAFTRLLDRVSFLNNIYRANPFDASIVIVLHGNEINYFAIKNYQKYKELMDRAKSLTVAGPIKFHMCQVAARGLGYAPQDIHGFVKVVPMADAEIIRLQREEGYAYMQ